MNLDFLHRIRWAQLLLQFESMREIDVPAFPGPSIRGALGQCFREALCSRRPPCEQECADPDSCSYALLFERDRLHGSGGRNIPKPYILGAPVPDELQEIVSGGEAKPPYRVVSRGERYSSAMLVSESLVRLPAAARLPVVLTFLGDFIRESSNIVYWLASRDLDYHGGRLRLRRVSDTWRAGRILFDADRPSAGVPMPQTRTFSDLVENPPRGRGELRIIAETPVLVKLGKQSCFDPRKLGEIFFQQMLVRAVRVHDAFRSTAVERLPRVDLDPDASRLVRWRAFRYKVPRSSSRQDKDMRFDGLVGFWDYEGDLSVLTPIASAAEVLHVGQKATFGLGRVACRTLGANS